MHWSQAHSIRPGCRRSLHRGERNNSGLKPKAAGACIKRFLRLDDARNQNQGGSGWRLAIARHIARSHGGDAACRTLWRFAARRVAPRRSCACRSGQGFFYLRCKSARARMSDRLSSLSASGSSGLLVVPRARRQRLTRSPSAVRRLRTTSASSRFCLR